MNCILNKQIVDQIENKETFEVHFLDTYEGYINIYYQNNIFYIEPAFCVFKILPKELYEKIKSMIVDDRVFNTDKRKIISGTTYDTFFNNFYNKLGEVESYGNSKAN